MIKSGRAFAFVAIAAFSSSSRAIPDIGKWATYGGPADAIDTELQGTVIWVVGVPNSWWNLFIHPDQGYEHLLITGNRIKPPPGEYDPNMFPGLETNWQSVIKLETTPVKSRPESNPTGAQIMVRLPDGSTRPVRAGDHVSVTGLWAIDYSHTMYSDLCTDAFSYMRGIYKACHAHAELHPFNVNSVTLTSTPRPAGSVVEEQHLLGAPVYEDYYSRTWEANTLAGIRGDLVDESIWTDWTKDSWVIPPNWPVGCTNCRAQVSLSWQSASGSAGWSVNYDETVNLHMTVHGTDVYNPALLIASPRVLINNCNTDGCSCLPAPLCVDTGAWNLSRFCGSVSVNCSGKCNITPTEPGFRSCLAVQPGRDWRCMCN